MSKVAVVFWSGTGNTQTMAEKVLEGAKEAGASAELFSVEEFSADKMDSYDAVAFGCPAMGDEVLEEDVFEPVFRECEAKLKDKKSRSVWLLRMGRRRMDAQLGENLQRGRSPAGGGLRDLQ